VQLDTLGAIVQLIMKLKDDDVGIAHRPIQWQWKCQHG